MINVNPYGGFHTAICRYDGGLLSKNEAFSLK